MNYRFTALLLPVILLCTFVSSCSSDQPAGTNSRPPAIYGRVLDSAGNPVANAGVSLYFSYVQGTADTSGSALVLTPQPAIDNIFAYFILQASGRVTVKLLRADTRALVKTVIDEVQEAGQHLIAVSANDIPNQAYFIRLETTSDTVEKLVIVNNPELPGFAPFVRTDNDGRFTIHYTTLPIGRSFLQVFENGAQGAQLAIGDSLRLGIDGPDMKDRIWRLKVDTTAVVDSTLRLP